MITRCLKYLFLFLTILLLSVQCKKDKLPEIPQENSPVFNVDGTLGESAISLHAGLEDAFMHTMVEQLNNVNQYSGELNDGKTAFKVQFLPTNIDIPSLYNKFSVEESYALSESYGTVPLLTISPEDFPHYDLINNIQWTVDNTPQSESTLKIYEPGKYRVCAMIHFNNGESENVCNTLIVGYQLHAHYTLDYTINQSSNLISHINAPSNEISKVSWYIDDVLQSNQIDYQPINVPDKFVLKAEVEFENGVVGIREVYINKSNPIYSIVDFTSLGQKTIKTWDKTLLITITKDGQTYTSVNGPTSHFDITKVSDFKMNSKGNEVKLVSGTLTTPFINNTSGEILTGDFKIDFGVAY